MIQSPACSKLSVAPSRDFATGIWVGREAAEAEIDASYQRAREHPLDGPVHSTAVRTPAVRTPTAPDVAPTPGHPR